MMIDKKTALLLIIVLFITLGCPARSRSTIPDGTDKDNNVVSGSVTEGNVTLPNTGSMDSDIEEVDKGEFTTSPADTSTTTTTTTETHGTVEPPVTGGTNSSVNTYRVQVMASSTSTGADDIAGKVRGQVSDEKVFIDYVGGLYKVRVGACGDYATAAALRDRLIGAGYSDSWVVKAGVQ
jgi:hypothetical protein